MPFRPLAVVAAGAAALVLIASCGSPGGLTGYLANSTAPRKPSRTAPAPEAQAAKAAFAQALLDGAYEQLPDITDRLTAAYLDHPYDPALALSIAHAHLWRVSERARDPAVSADPSVTDDLVVAAYYFDQAMRLDPGDRRIPGWLGSVELALGTIHNEQEFLRRGYYRLGDASRAYPEFNGFTFGYAMSGADSDDDRYAEALQHMWLTASRCTGGRTTAKNPGLASGAPPVDPDPACWDSPKAPRNFEGFWWILGQMELKAGNLERGRTALRNAALASDYPRWRFREQLERDLAESESLAAGFAARDPATEARMIFGSAAACTACHAR